MLQLKTSSEELWRVLPEEHDKAIYWLKKHFGGEERYEKMRDDLLIRCRRAGWPMASEVVDYTSKRGNRWVCFEQATYYPECHGSHCMPYAFCYYETAVSLGVFSLGFTQMNGMDHVHSVFIYTPHFFQRYCERMGIKGSPRRVLMSFMEMSPLITVALLPKEDDDLQKIIVRFPGCVCHGIARKDDRHVFEVRTLLTDGQLSGKQSQDTQEVRKYGDFLRFVRGLTVFNNCKTLKL